MKSEKTFSNLILPLIMLATAFVVLLLTLYPYYQVSPPAVTRPIPVPTVNIFKYTCPKSEWVDCMPGPGPTKAQCQPGYLDWAKNNCPDFQGAAL